MSLIGCARKISKIEYGASSSLYIDDYEEIINMYNEMIEDDMDRLYANAAEHQWEFDINSVEKMLSFFDNMPNKEKAEFILSLSLNNNFDAFISDFKNWLDDGKQAGTDNIIIDWF